MLFVMCYVAETAGSYMRLFDVYDAVRVAFVLPVLTIRSCVNEVTYVRLIPWSRYDVEPELPSASQQAGRRRRQLGHSRRRHQMVVTWNPPSRYTLPSYS